MHTGTVQFLERQQAGIFIPAQSGCGSCAASGSCAAAGKGGGLVWVAAQPEMTIGSKVELEMSSRKDLLASLLAFVVPVLLIVLAVFAGSLMGFSEIISALAGFGLMAVYLLVLFGVRKKLDSTFAFKVKRVIG